MIGKFYLFTALVFFSATARCQLINNGGALIVQNGAYVMVTGNVTNSNGTITNDGKIEAQGNFINTGTGTYTSTGNEDSLIMTGTGIDTLNVGSTIIHNLTINKTTGADMIRLGATTTVNTTLDYLSGVLSTDPVANPSFKLVSPVAAVYNFAASKEIIGSVMRTGWTNGTARTFNQANMQVATNTGTAPTSFTVTMLPQSGGGDPTQSEREVKRKFLFAPTGGSGYTANIRYPYVTGELNTNVEDNLVPWNLVSSEWNAHLTPVTHDVVNHYVSLTGIAAADLAMEWKLADPKYTFNVTAYLRGAWNGTAMNTSLNSGGIIPLSQPYNVTPFNYAGTESVASIPNATIVDWVLVEHRKPSTGLPADASSATITGRKVGFLLNNGTVVDLDGVTPIAFNITKQGPSFIVIRHRNHLGVLSNSVPSNTAGTFANDYTALANSYKPAGAPSNPVVLLSGGVKYGLWSGDANKNGVVNATDVNVIKIAVAASASGYLNTDANLSNSINATDASLTKITISSSGTGGVLARGQVALKGKIKTNIPDPIFE